MFSVGLHWLIIENRSLTEKKGLIARLRDLILYGMNFYILEHLIWKKLVIYFYSDVYFIQLESKNID